MTTQPEALRLAALLDINHHEPRVEQAAAAELRRLHAEVEALRATQVEQEPVAWINHPMKNDEVGNFLTHGKPELGFKRFAYGYDWQKAQPLYTAPQPQVEPASHVINDDVLNLVSLALRKAWQLGQTYWQQADSEFISHQKKSDATRAKFQALIDETRAALATTPLVAKEGVMK